MNSRGSVSVYIYVRVCVLFNIKIDFNSVSTHLWLFYDSR